MVPDAEEVPTLQLVMTTVEAVVHWAKVTPVVGNTEQGLNVVLIVQPPTPPEAVR